VRILKPLLVQKTVTVYHTICVLSFVLNAFVTKVIDSHEAAVNTIKQLSALYYPRVGTRVITPFLLAIILIAGIGVFTVTRLIAFSIQDRFNLQLIDSANAASNAIVEIERQMLETLRLMAYTSGTAAAVQARDTTTLENLLLPHAANNRVEDVIVFGSDGTGIFRLRREGDDATSPYVVREPLNTANWQGAMRVTALLSDDRGDKFADIVAMPEGMMLYISAPVTIRQADGRSEVVGGISVGISMVEVALRSGAQALSSLAFYAPDGILLASTFRTVDATALQINSARAAEIFTSTDTLSPMTELRTSDTDGGVYQILYAPFRIRDDKVGLIGVGLPTNFLTQQTDNGRNLFALLFLVLFVIVAIIGRLVARSIVQPVGRLVATTRAILQGELNKRVDLQTRDELGELAASFDTMTDDLVQRNQQIAELYEAQVQETAQREAVLTNISDAVFVQDTQGNIILQNRTAYRLIQRVQRDPSLKDAFQVLLTDPNALSPHEPMMLEFSDNYYSTLTTPVQLPDGEALGRVTVFRDVSAIVRAEKLKDQLILQMSHELRTPLAALRGNIDLIRVLEKKNLSEKGVGFLQKSVDHLGTLERLINQVVDVSSIVAGKFYVNRRSIDLVPLLRQQVNLWQPKMESRGLGFEMALPDEQICVYGDEERLAQLLDHVLRNAYSYTLSGGVVRAAAKSNSDLAIIAIADSGVGIKPNEMNQVFERMYRGSAADAGPTDSRGLGLGLYLSKNIVEAHEGNITIDSEPGEGTVVWIKLPLHSPNDNQ
jgi:signal transduction histidine kinase